MQAYACIPVGYKPILPVLLQKEFHLVLEAEGSRREEILEKRVREQEKGEQSLGQRWRQTGF